MKNDSFHVLTALLLVVLLAAFFCTLHYLKSSPDAVSRMVGEGHIVGNHTAHHPSDCSALSRQELADEIQEVHNYMREIMDMNVGIFGFQAEGIRKMRWNSYKV